MTTKDYREKSHLAIFLHYFKPHRKLFVLDLTFLGWRAAAALTLGILNVYVLPYTTLADPGYYEDALRRTNTGTGQENTQGE